MCTWPESAATSCTSAWPGSAAVTGCAAGSPSTRAAVAGLGEAVVDRALADSGWITARLHDLRANGPTRPTEWAAAAFDREPLDVAWSATADGKAAEQLEHQILVELTDAALWNRARPRR